MTYYFLGYNGEYYNIDANKRPCLYPVTSGNQDTLYGYSTENLLLNEMDELRTVLINNGMLDSVLSEQLLDILNNSVIVPLSKEQIEVISDNFLFSYAIY